MTVDLSAVILSPGYKHQYFLECMQMLRWSSHLSLNFVLGYERYCRLRSDVLQYVPFPDIVVYLNAGPQECHKRIVERGRVIDLCSLTIDTKKYILHVDIHLCS